MTELSYQLHCDTLITPSLWYVIRVLSYIGTQGCINWYCRDQDLKTAEPRGKNQLEQSKDTTQKQKKQN